MKKAKLIFTLLAFSSIIKVDAGWAMMADAVNVARRITVAKRIPSPMIQKRTLHTPQLKTRGFNPEEPIDVTTWHILNLPKRVEYLDANHEVFKTPEKFQEQIEASLCRNGTEQSAKKDDFLKKK